MSQTLDRLPISVVIPAYCATETLPRAIASIATQTRLPLEVIIVDDASPDDTWATINTLAAKYPSLCIKPHRADVNQGASNARNKAWDAAKGEYIAFLDADDTWHPQKLEIQFACMSANPQIDLCGHAHEIQSPPHSSHPQFDQSSALVITTPISKRKILLSNPFTPTTVMLKRRLPNRFPNGQRHMEDHALWMNLFLTNHLLVKQTLILGYQHKPPYGFSGLSSQMWRMEKAELENYRTLRRSGYISSPLLYALCSYSLLKFIRRLILCGLTRLRSSHHVPNH